MTISKTPKGSFFIGYDSRFQSSFYRLVGTGRSLNGSERNTEITNEECLRGIWGPFPIGDVVLLVDIEAELVSALAELVQAALVLVYASDPVLCLGESFAQGVLEGREPRVEGDHTWGKSATPRFFEHTMGYTSAITRDAIVCRGLHDRIGRFLVDGVHRCTQESEVG